MLSILVASSKGGCGKSTLCTGLAGYFALAGKRTVLLDADPQGSATRWCEQRAGASHPVLAVDGTRRHWQRKLPGDCQRLLIDAPAGAMGAHLEGFIEQANAILVPVLPSPVDLHATLAFLASLRELPMLRRGQRAIGLVGNRLRPWTAASQNALAQLQGWPYPQVASLRDSQSYVLLAGLGRCLFDYQSQAVRAQQEDWVPLLGWLREINLRRPAH